MDRFLKQVVREAIANKKFENENHWGHVRPFANV